MHAYCMEVLHLSEAEAYFRIAAARAARRHPMLLDMLADGRLHLSGIERLAPHLTPKNRDALLKRATHRSKREIERLVAELQPRPDVRPTIRKLPVRPVIELRPDGVRGARVQDQLRPDGVRAPLVPPVRPAEVKPLAPERYKVQFTASAELREKLERLQALAPSSDLAAVIEQAVTERLERLEARRFGKAKKPRKTLAATSTSASTRYIPAPVRRAVHERDGGRCTFVDAKGRRCEARRLLEFHHHDRPFGKGGDHRPGNIRLMCKMHNLLLAEREYGKEWMDRYRGGAASATEASTARDGPG